MAAIVAAALSALLTLVPVGPAAAAPLAHTPPPTVTTTLQWSDLLGDPGCPVAQSSPILANLDGQPAAVVGDRAGNVYAFHLSDGSSVKGWPAIVQGAAACAPGAFTPSGCPKTIDITSSVPVDSTPSVSGPPGAQTVYVGSGNAACPGVGGYQAFRPNGSLRWFTQVTDPGTDAQPAQGVQASLTVAPLVGGGPDVVAGSLDQEEYALNGSSGSPLPGWPYFTADSMFSTAAVGDLYGTGQPQIVEGGDSSAGFGRGQGYNNGGHLRILNAQGGQICRADTDQTVDSSPAIGGFLPGGGTGIVTGTGAFFPGASTTNSLRAYDTRCHLVWSQTLDGSTFSSPALGDLSGTGTLDAVEGTDRGAQGGSVWAFDAASGTELWQAPAVGRVIGSITTADLTGTDHQDLLVPTTSGLEMMDGTTGADLGVLAGDLGLQNSALVTDDPGGALGITVAGYNGDDQGVVRHFEVSGVSGTVATAAGSWPMFHHDPQLTGNAGGTPVPGSVPRCQVPSAALSGYREVASDGGIFSFGHAPFCGSTGGRRLNAPVVGMAEAPNTGGYWLVASDGGVFAYGGAQYFGSMGGRHLDRPIVAIAATPDGGGYWMVAADGGVFAFGDAPFFGSTHVGTPANPVVGMAVTGDGQGYRLATADGGVYTFGDAQFFGALAGSHLAAPIVAVANDISTGGYWLIASDGGVFTFLSPYFGSTGATRLARPVVGAAPSLSGDGYRLVASDGGMFSFGDAQYEGSTGGRRLNKPMVGVAGT